MKSSNLAPRATVVRGEAEQIENAVAAVNRRIDTILPEQLQHYLDAIQRSVEILTDESNGVRTQDKIDEARRNYR